MSQATPDPDETCAAPGCDFPRHVRGYCKPHYERLRKTGTVDGPPLGPRAIKAACSVDGCTRGRYCKGYCKPHYQRLQKTGTVGDAPVEARTRTTWAENPDEATCVSCGETKPAEDFYMQSTDPSSRLYGRRQGRCKECVKAAGNQWRGDNPELLRERQVGYMLQFNFGITPAQYAALLAAQGGGCGICGERPQPGKPRLHVDHDHQTGAIRGILCSPCNTSLGLFCEDIRMLERAAEYLERDAA